METSCWSVCFNKILLNCRELWDLLDQWEKMETRVIRWVVISVYFELKLRLCLFFVFSEL